MKPFLAWTLVIVAAGDLHAQDGDRGSSPVRVEDEGWRGTVRLFLGAKDLDESDWAPVESQGEFAILTNFGRADWDVHLALDLRFASSDEEEFLGVDVLSASYEVNVGVRKMFDTGTFVTPFLGGGISFGGATFEIDGEEEDDSGVGIWFDAGVDFSLGGPISLGLEVALSTLPIEIDDFDTDAGGLRFGITLGFSW
jgi:hypothetical protein